MGFEIKPPPVGRVWIFSGTMELREKVRGGGGESLS